MESTPCVVELSRELGTESIQLGTLGLHTVDGVLAAANQRLSASTQLARFLHVILPQRNTVSNLMPRLPGSKARYWPVVTSQ